MPGCAAIRLGRRRANAAGIAKPIGAFVIVALMLVDVRAAIVVAAMNVDWSAVIAARSVFALMGGRPGVPSKGPQAFEPLRCC